MRKTIIISLLVVLNALLLTTLIYVGSRPPAPAPANAQASSPTTVAPAVAAAPDEELMTLQAGEHLNSDRAPQLAGRALVINATFDSRGRDGVIVAQGGLAHGYALYVQEGELIFALRRNNALTTLSAGKIEAGRHVVTASLAADGQLSLSIDDRAPVTAKSAGLLTLMPVDGLDAGADRGAPVGNYAVPNEFGGTIEAVTVKTRAQ